MRSIFLDQPTTGIQPGARRVTSSAIQSCSFFRHHLFVLTYFVEQLSLSSLTKYRQYSITEESPQVAQALAVPGNTGRAEHKLFLNTSKRNTSKNMFLKQSYIPTNTVHPELFWAKHVSKAHSSKEEEINLVVSPTDKKFI